LRIAVWHNLPSGGGKRALYHHVRGLLARGHSVESWCPPTADQTYLPLKTMITEHIVPFAWEERSGRTALSNVLAGYRNVADNIAAMDRHCQQCAEEINRGGFDLLLANACMFYAVTAIGRYVKLSKVLYLQEPCRDLYEARPRLPWIALPSPDKRGWNFKYLKSVLRNSLKVQGMRVQAREEALNAQAFDTILVNSFFSRESVLRTYGLDARVCYLGIDTALFSNHHLPREDFVMSVGVLAPAKGVEFILQAVAEMHAPRPRLVWVGNSTLPGYIEAMQRLAVSLGVAFELRMRVSDAELVDLLNRAAVMVYAPRLEPFGLAPLEANACGLPVVAVAEGGVRETIIDGVNGLLADHDAPAMARALERLRDDREYASRLGESAQQLVAERWTWGAAIDRLEHLLERTLAARSSKQVSERA
jgi:glycosyltransferase involved in cell wall biosynthesis